MAQTIHECFRDCARTDPDRVAVRYGTRLLAYRELDQLSDRLAAGLHARGVGAGTIVPVLLPRSPLLVAALLGILKTGAAYAALDPAWPAQHIARCLSLLPSPLIAASRAYDTRPAWQPALSPSAAPSAPPEVAVSGNDPCCVFFSSGTTGEPKGVIAPHDGTVRLFRGASFATLGPGSMMPQAAPLPWDGLTLELWSMLTTGGTVILMEPGPLSPARLRSCVQAGVTLVWITASLFNLLVDEDVECFSGLTQVLAGGERLSPWHVRRFIERHPDIRLTNGYGPAEATVFVTTHDITMADCDDVMGIPIGKSVADTELIVLDGDRNCGEGQVGELCVTGPRLGLSYLGGVQGGFTIQHPGGRSRRLFRTGDLVLLRDGLFYFVGRKDRQVKVAGHRLEPQGIEREVMCLPGIERCTVVPLRMPTGVSALALFYRAVGDSPVSEQEVRDYLRAKLPAYAIPIHIRSVGSFPLTGNGKLDEAALASLVSAPPGSAAAPDRRDGEAGTSLERRVAAVVGSILGNGHVPVGAGLHELGMTSLDIVRTCMRLERELGATVPMERLQRNPDVRSVAGLIKSGLESSLRPECQASPKVTLTPAAASFLIDQEIEPEDTSSICPMLWYIRGPLDITALKHAIDDVAARHDSLTAAYTIDAAAIAAPRAAARSAASLLVIPDVANLSEARVAVDAYLYGQPLRLADGEVWRAAVATVRSGTGDANSHVLGIGVHHVTFDGWSESILARDLTVAYNSRREGHEPQYRTAAPRMEELAAAYQRRQIPDSERTESLNYWKTKLKDTAELEFRVPPTADCVSGSPRAGFIRTRVVPARHVARCRSAAEAHGTTLFPVLLASYAKALGHRLRDPDVAIGVPVVARERSLEEDAIGCMINMLSLRLNADSGAGPGDAISRAASEFASAYAHRNVSFFDVVRAVRPRQHKDTPIYQATCTLQDNDSAALEFRGCSAEYVRGHPPDVPVRLMLEFSPTASGGLRIELSFQKRHVRPEDANELVADLARLLADQ